MPRKPIKNGLQRRQFGRGERRLRGHELTSYLAMANSEDSKERLKTYVPATSANELMPLGMPSTVDFRTLI